MNIDFKGWKDLDTRQWWIAVVLVSGALLVGAGSTGHATTAIISGGSFVWGIGEWIQHPYQQFRRNGQLGNTYQRVWSVGGVALNVLGIVLIVFALFRFVRLGGRLF